ncbi:MAG: hypothetical protein SGI92_13355 [Bryobacteraceae bacterium]|nr:hypothetical protein [Bryobacteraceae bacterium]
MRAVLFTVATALVLLSTSCSNTEKAATPPKPGTLAYDWYAANENWKTGEYPKAMEHLARLAVAPSEYRDRSRVWLMLVAGGVAQGYNELANEYEKMARGNPEFRRQMQEVRNSANMAAMQYGEALRDALGKNKDGKLVLDFGFPTGSADLPLQMAKIGKGMSMQAADYQVVREKMAQRGVVKFAAALAGSAEDTAKAQTQFAASPRETVLTAAAKGLISTAELYGPKKLDVPQRGNALVKMAVDAISLVPDSKEKKEVDKQAQEALKKYKIQS